MSETDGRHCASCRYFDNAPATLEQLIPGLRSLSSGFAAVRDRDGLCRFHDRYLPASAGCSDFAAALTKRR
jgi:hypothetical protein